MFYVYKITNKMNGKVYIGKTINVDRRYRHHMTSAFSAGKNRNDCAKFYRNIRKYGVENFSQAEILASFEMEDEAYAAEKQFILEYDSIENGMNISTGGRGVGSGIDNPNYGQREKFQAVYKNLSEETKKALHAPYVGAKHSSESGKKAYQTRLDNGCIPPMTGKHHSEDSKKKISTNRTGKHSGADHYLYGKQVSEENCKKMSESHKGKGVGSNSANAKLNEEQVLYIKRLLSEGVSGAEIARQFNVTSNTISKIKRGKAWTHVKIDS